MSTIDEDERERERRPHSIVPFRTFPLTSKVSPPMHKITTSTRPLSSVSGASANPCLRPARARVLAWVLGKHGTRRRGPACDPNLEAIYAHQGQLATCAVDGESHMAGGGRGTGKIQLEEQIQGQHHPRQQYPLGQMMQMKGEDEEHKVVPVDELGGCPRTRMQAAEV